MSKITLKQVVESRYKLYKDYVKAYESVDKKSIIDEIKPFLNTSNSKDGGFRKIAMEIVKMENLYPQEISRHEVKFFEAVSIYLLTEKEGLPTDILTEYNTLNERFPKDKITLDKGKIIQTSEDIYSNLPDDVWEALLKDIESKLEN